MLWLYIVIILVSYHTSAYIPQMLHDTYVYVGTVDVHDEAVSALSSCLQSNSYLENGSTILSFITVEASDDRADRCSISNYHRQSGRRHSVRLQNTTIDIPCK